VRAVRNTDQGIRVVETDRPPADGSSADAVRVTVAAAGICGSDLHLASFGPSAVTLGHEFGGRLDDGTPVAVLPVVPCGRCDRCLAGDGQQCASALGAMYGITRDGGLADEVWVDPTCPKVLPDSIPLEQAGLVEPLAVALHGLNRSGVEPGMRLVVVGGGTIGLCTVALARSLGHPVDLEAHHRSRLEAGERLGAGTAGGGGYDVVLDAAGTQSSMERAFELVRPGGTIGVLGTYWDPVSLGVAFQMKEVTLVPAFAYGHHHGVSEFEEAVRLLAGLPGLADTVITHRFPLDDATEAFRVAGDRSTGAIKVVLHP
jgi:threonine dehydrogenase-like Zn-dependent dehydrogenase